MEVPTLAEGSPPRSPRSDEDNEQANPLRPEVEEEDAAATPPTGAPTQDTELVEGDDDAGKNNEDSDDESALSEIDEAQFEDFDPSAIAIEERPVAVDETNVDLIGKHKRKRADGGEEGERKKKRKEKRREKPKNRRPKDLDDDFVGGEEIEGKRTRKKKDIMERRDRPAPKARTPENEDQLSPEERRKRALDRAMDEALRNPNRRKKRPDGIDVEAQNDELIEGMRRRMADAAEADTNARRDGEPAMQKLKMLPEVISLLNRNNLRDQVVDPDSNILEAVRFFLEPLDDGSLPAYNIQREIFAVLEKLPINKDALVASGIGKVVLFYVKSTKPEPNIKRQAERLVGEWTRPILKRSDDYRKKHFVTKEITPSQVSQRVAASQNDSTATAAAIREKKLEAPWRSKRARIETGVDSYTIAPRSNIQNQAQDEPPDERTLKLGKTVRILHERLPTLLASPLPQEVLSPQISLHLFPSTHPHLPAVSGRISYTAALWTAPVAWGRVPVVGNVKLIVLSERMVKNGPSSPSYRSEKLIVKWKTCGKTKGRGMGGLYRGIGGSGDQVDKITEFLGGDVRDDEEFSGVFIFEFDEEGRVVSHTIEHAEQGGNFERMTRVVSVTDWLIGLAKGRKAQDEPGYALGYIEMDNSKDPRRQLRDRNGRE